MRKALMLIFMGMFLLGGNAIFARQDTTSFKEVWQRVNHRMETKKARKIEEGRVVVSPAIIPGYTPELKFMLSGGGIISWTNNREDRQLPRSNMAVGFALSSTGAMVVNLRPVTFWSKDRFRLNGEIWYKDMPDNYWGIGYQNGFAIPETDTTTAYRRQWFQFRGDALFRIRGDLFAGLTWDLNHTEGSEESAGVVEDPDYILYNDRPLNTGFGVVARYDSRDITANAWEGLFLNALFVIYSPGLGGDNAYQMALFDYRQYHRIGGRDGRVLAWRMVSRTTFGEVPYGEMSQLGTPFDLRGYTWGRYRDKSMAFGILEYRHTFKRRDGNLSRHGAVTWLGAGTVYDFGKNGDSDWGETNNLLPNAGIGYRLEVQPRLNMRLDFGIGRKTTGFYFNIVEAF